MQNIIYYIYTDDLIHNKEYGFKHEDQNDEDSLYWKLLSTVEQNEVTTMWKETDKFLGRYCLRDQLTPRSFVMKHSDILDLDFVQMSLKTWYSCDHDVDFSGDPLE